MQELSAAPGAVTGRVAACSLPWGTLQAARFSSCGPTSGCNYLSAPPLLRLKVLLPPQQWRLLLCPSSCVACDSCLHGGSWRQLQHGRRRGRHQGYGVASLMTELDGRLPGWCSGQKRRADCNGRACALWNSGKQERCETSWRLRGR